MERTKGDLQQDMLICSNPYLQHYTIYFDVRVQDGVCDFVSYDFDHQPSIDEIKHIVLEYYNAECEKEIVSGFVYENARVWLSVENQFNYKAAFDLAMQTQGLTLPVVFKFGTDDAPVYRSFDTLEELQEFYIAAMKFVNATLLKFWEKKDRVDWSMFNI